MKYLHIAPQNISDVPMTLVRAERALGIDSRLITFFPDARGYPEDICLHLPFVDHDLVRRAKRWFSDPSRLKLPNTTSQNTKPSLYWRPFGLTERAFIRLREMIWAPLIRQAMEKIDFWNFDVYQFDAGLDFFRDGRTGLKLKQLHKKIVVCYTGSDLRTRGIIKPLDQIADLRLTLEWDHLKISPELVHILVPFEPERYQYKERTASDMVKIGHAPTNRAAKGSDSILSTLQKFSSMRHIEIVLIENKSHKEALQMKEQCDIFIDHYGNLGYGVNSLEAIAMGIPTCSGLTSQFVAKYPDHPFVDIHNSLEEQILNLIDKPDWRIQLARQGREWLERHHDSRRIVKQILDYLEVSS